MGVNLWGESPLYVCPASVVYTCTITRQRQELAPDVIRGTETACKAESPGELAGHNNTLDSGETVNAAVVSRKVTFLSVEICSTGI